MYTQGVFADRKATFLHGVRQALCELGALKAAQLHEILSAAAAAGQVHILR
jgi:hypothetical protein